MNIRIYHNKDQQAVIKLWQDCGLVTAKNNPANDIERKLKVDPDLLLVGENETGLVATVMGGYEGHRGWINYLAVRPCEQRKGYGLAMMQAVEQRIKQKGCPKINLQVRSSNQAVIAFYTALGYNNDNVISLGKRLKQDSKYENSPC